MVADRFRTYTRVVYILVFLCLLMLGAMSFGIAEIVRLENKDAVTRHRAELARVHLHADQVESTLRLRSTCERANDLRAATKLLLDQMTRIATVVGSSSTSPELRGYFRGISGQFKPYATKQGLQQRDCVKDYPLSDGN